VADRVTFTPGSADRIAKVVRTVEAGNRDATGYVASPRLQGVAGKVFRVCTFTGSWSVGSSKTVTFKYQTTTPNTASALNLFFPITETAAAADCAIAKDGTAWYLIDVPFQTATISIAQVTATGIFASTTASAVVVQSTASITFASGTANTSVLSGISLAATLNTNDCTITISQTSSTTNVVVAGSTATAIVVGATATAISISSAATAIFVTQTATAAVLTFKVT